MQYVLEQSCIDILWGASASITQYSRNFSAIWHMYKNKRDTMLKDAGITVKYGIAMAGDDE